MSAQQGLQELLRLLTSRKIPMLAAMGHVKALQGVGLQSIHDIAHASYEVVTSAVPDAKTAKTIKSACESHLKNSSKRVAGPEDTRETTKRARVAGAPVDDSVAKLEESLRLPVSTAEDEIAITVLYTNRAPVVLAFAVELIRYTMPEQPPSSRLSLAQAVVSANSRAKAVSLGLEKGPPAEESSWGEGQPKVTIMKRPVSVLKRSGYEWRGEEVVKSAEAGARQTPSSSSAPSHQLEPNWAVSSTIYSKSSSFVAHITTIERPSERVRLMDALMEAKPHLKTATHNAWGFRVRKRTPGSVESDATIEDSFDDGETMCGAFIERILREAGAFDVLVVLSRWFGGVLLGPDRWRLMRNCVTEALADRLRVAGDELHLGGEALWALDLEAMRSNTASGTSRAANYNQPVVGAIIHRPESARDYLLKSFASAVGEEPTATASPTKGKTGMVATKKALEAQKERNLSLLLGALRLVYDSWADHISPLELDARAWEWYVAVRPDVDSGPSGWGAKGSLRLSDVLNLRRKG